MQENLAFLQSAKKPNAKPRKITEAILKVQDALNKNNLGVQEKDIDNNLTLIWDFFFTLIKNNSLSIQNSIERCAYIFIMRNYSFYPEKIEKLLISQIKSRKEIYNKKDKKGTNKKDNKNSSETNKKDNTESNNPQDETIPYDASLAKYDNLILQIFTIISPKISSMRLDSYLESCKTSGIYSIFSMRGNPTINNTVPKYISNLKSLGIDFHIDLLSSFLSDKVEYAQIKSINAIIDNYPSLFLRVLSTNNYSLISFILSIHNNNPNDAYTPNLSNRYFSNLNNFPRTDDLINSLYKSTTVTDIDNFLMILSCDKDVKIHITTKKGKSEEESESENQEEEEEESEVVSNIDKKIVKFYSTSKFSRDLPLSQVINRSSFYNFSDLPFKYLLPRENDSVFILTVKFQKIAQRATLNNCQKIFSIFNHFLNERKSQTFSEEEEEKEKEYFNSVSFYDELSSACLQNLPICINVFSVLPEFPLFLKKVLLVKPASWLHASDISRVFGCLNSVHFNKIGGLTTIVSKLLQFSMSSNKQLSNNAIESIVSISNINNCDQILQVIYNSFDDFDPQSTCINLRIASKIVEKNNFYFCILTTFLERILEASMFFQNDLLLLSEVLHFAATIKNKTRLSSYSSNSFITDNSDTFGYGKNLKFLKDLALSLIYAYIQFFTGNSNCHPPQSLHTSIDNLYSLILNYVSSNDADQIEFNFLFYAFDFLTAFPSSDYKTLALVLCDDLINVFPKEVSNFSVTYPPHIVLQSFYKAFDYFSNSKDIEVASIWCNVFFKITESNNENSVNKQLDDKVNPVFEKMADYAFASPTKVSKNCLNTLSLYLLKCSPNKTKLKNLVDNLNNKEAKQSTLLFLYKEDEAEFNFVFPNVTTVKGSKLKFNMENNNSSSSGNMTTKSRKKSILSDDYSDEDDDDEDEDDEFERAAELDSDSFSDKSQQNEFSFTFKKVKYTDLLNNYIQQSQTNEKLNDKKGQISNEKVNNERLNEEDQINNEKVDDENQDSSEKVDSERLNEEDQINNEKVDNDKLNDKGQINGEKVNDGVKATPVSSTNSVANDSENVFVSKNYLILTQMKYSLVKFSLSQLKVLIDNYFEYNDNDSLFVLIIYCMRNCKDFPFSDYEEKFQMTPFRNLSVFLSNLGRPIPHRQSTSTKESGLPISVISLTSATLMNNEISEENDQLFEGTETDVFDQFLYYYDRFVYFSDKRGSKFSILKDVKSIDHLSCNVAETTSPMSSKAQSSSNERNGLASSKNSFKVRYLYDENEYDIDSLCSISSSTDHVFSPFHLPDSYSLSNISTKATLVKRILELLSLSDTIKKTIKNEKLSKKVLKRILSCIPYMNKSFLDNEIDLLEFALIVFSKAEKKNHMKLALLIFANIATRMKSPFKEVDQINKERSKSEKDKETIINDKEENNGDTDEVKSRSFSLKVMGKPFIFEKNFVINENFIDNFFSIVRENRDLLPREELITCVRAITEKTICQEDSKLHEIVKTINSTQQELISPSGSNITNSMINFTTKFENIDLVSIWAKLFSFKGIPSFFIRGSSLIYNVMTKTIQMTNFNPLKNAMQAIFDARKEFFNGMTDGINSLLNIFADFDNTLSTSAIDLAKKMQQYYSSQESAGASVNNNGDFEQNITLNQTNLKKNNQSANNDNFAKFNSQACTCNYFIDKVFYDCSLFVLSCSQIQPNIYSILKQYEVYIVDPRRAEFELDSEVLPFLIKKLNTSQAALKKIQTYVASFILPKYIATVNFRKNSSEKVDNYGSKDVDSNIGLEASNNSFEVGGFNIMATSIFPVYLKCIVEIYKIASDTVNSTSSRITNNLLEWLRKSKDFDCYVLSDFICEWNILNAEHTGAENALNLSCTTFPNFLPRFFPLFAAIVKFVQKYNKKEDKTEKTDDMVSESELRNEIFKNFLSNAALVSHEKSKAHGFAFSLLADDKKLKDALDLAQFDHDCEESDAIISYINSDIQNEKDAEN